MRDWNKPYITRMQPYDGDGFVCYVADGSGGNVGFGDTQRAAFESWRRGEDIGAAAWVKWYGIEA